MTKMIGENNSMNMGAIKNALKDELESNELLFPVYKKWQSSKEKPGFVNSALRAYSFEAEEGEKLRINLILPTLRKTKIFGGAATAIQFMQLIRAKLKADARIIVLQNELADSRWEYHVKGFSVKNKDKNICMLAGQGKLSVRKNDVFIFTNWVTACSLMPVLEWQNNAFHEAGYRGIYFIQDYEPGFYPWSSEYALAESTYRKYADSLIAVFNSLQLHTFFQNEGYRFRQEFCFTPALNSDLKAYLDATKNEKTRKKQILIYGRKREPRNAFELIRAALDEWSALCPDAAEWTILSLGEGFDDIPLKNNTIKVRGKVSLDEYARLMSESYAGISLMVSPHPSYPPLEMSTFGVRTITNCYKNKDLAGFNENIISLKEYDPATIAAVLSDLCSAYSGYESKRDVNPTYYDNDSMRACALGVSKLLCPGSSV